MDSEYPNLELVNVAIQKLKEEQRQIKEIFEDDDDDQLLLSQVSLSFLFSICVHVLGIKILNLNFGLLQLKKLNRVFIGLFQLKFIYSNNDIDEDIKSEASNESDSNYLKTQIIF
uniref:Uncharacterized protein n=1 Tax=Cannabis sativa TaxID=3483 RepID=A0A803R389_CANSA